MKLKKASRRLYPSLAARGLVETPFWILSYISGILFTVVLILHFVKYIPK